MVAKRHFEKAQLIIHVHTYPGKKLEIGICSNKAAKVCNCQGERSVGTSHAVNILWAYDERTRSNVES
jgi:hypothetical protein